MPDSPHSSRFSSVPIKSISPASKEKSIRPSPFTT